MSRNSDFIFIVGVHAHKCLLIGMCSQTHLGTMDVQDEPEGPQGVVPPQCPVGMSSALGRGDPTKVLFPAEAYTGSHQGQWAQ